MKRLSSILIRLLLGMWLASLLLYGLFALTLQVIPSWGATAEEVARPLPGDELTVQRTLYWTNAITIAAPPEDVWPWIAQLGDTRGGFYSYTFIENQVGALMGMDDYAVVYVNANEINPAWQDPQPGEAIIQGSLKIREVVPQKYLLADSILPAPFMWIWGWYIEPLDNGSMTRMLVRFAIEVPESEDENPVMGFLLNVGGFVMQQNMLQSLKLRAEGRTEPAWLESAEIGLWTAALLSGLFAMGMYLFNREWRKPLAIAVIAVIAIFVLTIVQPPILVRLLIDAGLVAGLAWAAKRPELKLEARG